MTDATLNLNIDADNARREVSRFNRGLRDTTTAGNRASESMSGLTKAAIALGGSLALRQITQTIANFDRLSQTMNIAFGSVEEGTEAFSRLRELALELPFSLDQLTTSATQLRAAGIEPTNEQLTLFADIAASSVDPVGALTAVTDLFARSTAGGLGLEDLNRLADRNIPVFRVLREELGLGRLQVAEYGKTASGAAEILRTLSEVLGVELQGAAASAADTLAGQIDRLEGSYTELLISLGDSGAIDALSNSIGGLSTLVQAAGNNLGTFAGIAGGAAVTGIIGYNRAVGAASISTDLFTAALRRNPLVLIISTAIAAGAAIVTFRQAVEDATQAEEEGLTTVERLEQQLEETRNRSRQGARSFNRERAAETGRQIRELETRLALARQLAESNVGTSRNPGGAGSRAQSFREQAMQQEEADRVRFEMLTRSLRTEEEELRASLAVRLRDINEGNRLGILNDEMASRARVLAEFEANRQIAEARVRLNETLAEIEAAANPEQDQQRGFEGSTPTGGTVFEEDMQAEMEANQLRLEELRRFLGGRALIIEESALLERERIRQAFEENLIGEQERNQLLLDAETDKQCRLAAIMEQGRRKKDQVMQASLKDSFKRLSQETSGLAQHNKGIFNLNKASAIAEATLALVEGPAITEGSYPFPFGQIFAGLHYVSALAKLNAVKNSTFQGGGGGTGGGASTVPSAIGQTPEVPITQPLNPGPPVSEQSRQTTVIVNVDGNVYESGDFTEIVVESLRNAEEDDLRRI